MPQTLVRDLDPRVIERLKQRAKSRDRSLEAEVRTILTDAAGRDTPEESYAKIMEFRKRFAGRRFSDSTEIIREDRDR